MSTAARCATSSIGSGATRLSSNGGEHSDSGADMLNAGAFRRRPGSGTISPPAQLSKHGVHSYCRQPGGVSRAARSMRLCGSSSGLPTVSRLEGLLLQRELLAPFDNRDQHSASPRPGAGRDGFHEGFAVEQAVAQDCVVNTVRRIERGDLPNPGQFLSGEIDREVWQVDHQLAHRREQRLLEPVRLALHAIDEHASNLGTIDPPALVDVPWAGAAPLLGIGRRDNLVPLASDRLPPPQRRVVRGSIYQAFVFH